MVSDAVLSSTASWILPPERKKTATPSTFKLARRRYFHLGVERDVPPPRDYEKDLGTMTIDRTREGTNLDRLSPQQHHLPEGDDEVRVSYRPYSAFDMYEKREDALLRKLRAGAHGTPPPTPVYLSDLDRNDHFVQPGGATDVTAQFRSHPTHRFEKPNGPPPTHTEEFKQFLTISAKKLSNERQIESRVRESLSRAVQRSRPTSAAVTTNATLLAYSRSHNASSLNISSSQNKDRARPSTALTSNARTVSRRTTPQRTSPMPSRPVSAASKLECPTSVELCERLSMEPRCATRSVRCSSASAASRQIREFRRRVHDVELLQRLTMHGHPNQVYVYLSEKDNRT